MRKHVSPLKLKTANGSIEVSECTTVEVDILGGDEFEVRVLPDTPNVLSVAQLVEQHGATFYWSTAHGALLTYKGPHQLEVQQGVPLLALAALLEKTGLDCVSQNGGQNGGGFGMSAIALDM